MGLALYSTVPLPEHLHPTDYYYGVSLDCRDEDEVEIVRNISYTRFGAFRADVARVLDIQPYVRFSRRRTLPTGAIAFWLHSDCDGTWSARECHAVATLLYDYIDAADTSTPEREDFLYLAARLSQCLDAVWHSNGEVRFC